MTKKLNAYNITYLILIGLTLIGDTFYILTGCADVINIGSNVWIKALASLSFVAIGIVSLIFVLKNGLNKKFTIVMSIGLTIAMIGDILLDIIFIVGAIFFALGHVAFFIAYCFLHPFKWKDLIIGGTIAIASVLVVLLVPIFTLDGIMLPLILCYATIISLMLGKAISNFIQDKSISNLLILLGSALFFFSDLMLLFYHFSTINIGATFCILCLITYYPAEILLALSPKYSKPQ